MRSRKTLRLRIQSPAGDGGGRRGRGPPKTWLGCLETEASRHRHGTWKVTGTEKQAGELKNISGYLSQIPYRSRSFRFTFASPRRTCEWMRGSPMCGERMASCNGCNRLLLASPIPSLRGERGPQPTEPPSAPAAQHASLSALCCFAPSSQRCRQFHTRKPRPLTPPAALSNNRTDAYDFVLAPARARARAARAPAPVGALRP